MSEPKRIQKTLTKGWTRVDRALPLGCAPVLLYHVVAGVMIAAIMLLSEAFR